MVIGVLIVGKNLQGGHLCPKRNHGQFVRSQRYPKSGQPKQCKKKNKDPAPENTLGIMSCGKIGGGFIILSEVLLEIYRNNYKIDEIHSVFVNRQRGESSVNLSLILQSFFGLIKLYLKKRKLNIL